MSYTRTCNGKDCNAELTWDDEKEWYYDKFFPNEKHDHARYAAVAAYQTEQSNNGHSATQPVNEHVEVSEGVECNVCKSRGSPNITLFFNEAAKAKSGKKIPLSRPDKVDGQFVFHEHVEEKGKLTDSATPPPVTGTDVNTAVQASPQDGVDFSQLMLNDTIRAFTHQLNTQQKWFEDSRDKIDTILAYVLDNTVKKANEQRTA